MIQRVKAFGAFWYDIVIGDDWRIATGVVLVLAVTDLVARHEPGSAWWLPLVGIAGLLPWSVHRVTRKRNNK